MIKTAKYVLNKRSVSQLSAYLQMMETEWFSEHFTGFKAGEMKKASPIIKKTFATVLEQLTEKQNLREDRLVSMWREALIKSWEQSPVHPSQTAEPVLLPRLQEVITEDALKSIFKLFANDQRWLAADRSPG